MLKNLSKGIAVASLASLAGTSAAQFVLIQDDEADWNSALSGPIWGEDFNDFTEDVVITGFGESGVVTDFGLMAYIASEFNFISSGGTSNNVDGTFYLEVELVGPPLPGEESTTLATFVFFEPITDFSFEFADFFAAGGAVNEGVDIYVDGTFLYNTRTDLGIVPQPLFPGSSIYQYPRTFIGLNAFEPVDAFTTVTLATSGFGNNIGIDNVKFTDYSEPEDYTKDVWLDAFDIIALQNLLATSPADADYNGSGGNGDAADLADLTAAIEAAIAAFLGGGQS